MRSILLLAAFLAPFSALAGEREWQPNLLGTVGALQRDGGLAIGFGADASAGYYFTDWLQLEVHLGGAHFSNVEEPKAPGADRGAVYAATRFFAAPMFRLTPGAGLWPHNLGDWFVPSISVGAGYAFENQTSRHVLYDGNSRSPESLPDLWRMSPELHLGLGADFRFANRFTTGLRVRATTPIGEDFARVWEFTAGLVVGLLFYP